MSEFTNSFRGVINQVDPISNSLMSKDNDPSIKILADWGRKACGEIDQLQTKNKRLKETINYAIGGIDALLPENKDAKAIKETLEKGVS